MNLVTGEIVSIGIEDGVRIARIRVAKAYVRVPLTLVPEACIGDAVLVESGVAIGRVVSKPKEEN